MYARSWTAKTIANEWVTLAQFGSASWEIDRPAWRLEPLRVWWAVNRLIGETGLPLGRPYRADYRGMRVMMFTWHENAVISSFVIPV